MKISVIIPVFNEEKVIGNCLASLTKQTIIKKMELIVVDDGSTDKTKQIVEEAKITLLTQNHQGPGAARNFGADKATGDILVFVDADMEFEPDFVEKLVAPIVTEKTIGTYSREEYLLNKDNPWARCWNLNLGRKAERMEPRDYDSNKGHLWNSLKRLVLRIEGSRVDASYVEGKQHVFRAILRKKFLEVSGFDTKQGYTDDWTLSEKLKTLADAAPDAKYYHLNPAGPGEVWRQARWYGKNEFLTKNFLRRSYNLVRYNPLLAILKGLVGAIRNHESDFFLFKIIFDTAVTCSVLKSFAGESKNR